MGATFIEFWQQAKEGSPWLHRSRTDDTSYINGTVSEAYDMLEIYRNSYAIADVHISLGDNPPPDIAEIAQDLQDKLARAS